jgi:hypothetical protein
VDHRHRPLPPDRAFVVRFRAGTDPAREDVAGLVEHVSSGRGVRFDSYEELLAFLRRQLASLDPSSDE